MDIFDIDGGTDDGVQLLKTALAAVVPADATPPEYSRLLAAQDVPRIRAATDVGNAPMAAAFAPGRLRHLRAPDRHDLAMIT